MRIAGPQPDSGELAGQVALLAGPPKAADYSGGDPRRRHPAPGATTSSGLGRDCRRQVVRRDGPGIRLRHQFNAAIDHPVRGKIPTEPQLKFQESYACPLSRPSDFIQMQSTDFRFGRFVPEY
jgi:hypothetical protein